MKRSTMRMWLQRCPSCGYCAPFISVMPRDVSDIVRSDSYQAQLNDPEFPELANTFLCRSLLEERARDLSGAGWDVIAAAWACDDAGCSGPAETCRKRAVALLQKAGREGQRFGQDAGAETAVLVDLLRRSRQFELALRYCEAGLRQAPSGLIADVLEYEKKLIAESDAACHTVAEAIGDREEPSA